MSSNSVDNGGSFRALKRALKRPITSVAVKNAVYTTVAIVSSYLICSGLHLVLTALERVDSELLKYVFLCVIYDNDPISDPTTTPQKPQFFTLDLVTQLVFCTCKLILSVYI